jgi:hypothetical protein
VPYFLGKLSDELAEILFGPQAQSLQRAGNALLLSNQVKKWLDTYHLVIVPVDTSEVPIMRWKVDIISPDIMNYICSGGARSVKDLDGRELTFLNKKRPVSRFLYFHFIMALVRIKDVERQGWRDVWARYYEQRPFPTPGNYLRQSMLLALATHFKTADMNVIDSWISDHGFDSPLKLTDDEATEAARLVHVELQKAISRAEKYLEDEGEDNGAIEGDDEDEAMENEEDEAMESEED